MLPFLCYYPGYAPFRVGGGHTLIEVQDDAAVEAPQIDDVGRSDVATDGDTGAAGVSGVVERPTGV